MSTPSARVRRVVIMGAAGRDFHNFNQVYREDANSVVVAFTAAQIPDIAGRRYPPVLAGPRYPSGIPIVDEAALEDLIAKEAVDDVVFAYSDLANDAVMQIAARVLAAGADFKLIGPRATMLKARVPVVAVSAVRTGCGKSQVSRWLSARLRAAGLRVAVLRHPMPYGDLARQAVQRFTSRADLAAAACTVEEREEYEPHLAIGNVVYAGVDYAAILARAEREADVVLWDGGNNDFPFVAPDLHVVLVDALRPADTASHHPGTTALRMADVVLAAKSNAAAPDAVEQALATARSVNPRAHLLRGASIVTLADPAAVRGRRVLVIEDGPTLTHGGMATGAGFAAARAAGVAAIVDPRAGAAPIIAAAYARYPHIGPVLPALGYSAAQLEALRLTIAASDAEVLIAATPCDLGALIAIDRPVVRARYEYAEMESPGLGGVIDEFVERLERSGEIRGHDT